MQNRVSNPAALWRTSNKEKLIKVQSIPNYNNDIVSHDEDEPGIRKSMSEYKKIFVPTRPKKNQVDIHHFRESPSLKDLTPLKDNAIKELQFSQNLNYLNYLESQK